MYQLIAAIPSILVAAEMASELFGQGQAAKAKVTGKPSIASTPDELRQEVSTLPSEQQAQWAKIMQQKVDLYVAENQRHATEIGIVDENMASLSASVPKNWADMYKEICHNVRVTDDVSFKLLGIVPVAAGVGSGGLTILEKGHLLAQPELAVLLLSILGAFMTFALFQWELRNIQKCKWLISRGAALERQVLKGGAAEFGQFLGMTSAADSCAMEIKDVALSSVLKMPWGKTQAEKLIYTAAIAVWFVPMLVAFKQLV